MMDGHSTGCLCHERACDVDMVVVVDFIVALSLILLLFILFGFLTYRSLHHLICCACFLFRFAHIETINMTPVSMEHQLVSCDSHRPIANTAIV